MGLQSFYIGEADDFFSHLVKGFFIIRQETAPFYEIIDSHGRGKGCRPHSREGMVRAGKIVPDGFRRIGSDENGAGILDFIYILLCIGEIDFQMFRTR